MRPVISLANVAVHTGRATLLDGVTLEVMAGEVLALVGPNGAGKTTLMNVIAGVRKPDFGTRAAFVPPGGLAYLAQDGRLPLDWTVRELVELGRLPHQGAFRRLDTVGWRSVTAALERTSTLGLAERTLGTLSGGQRQRAALARALAQEARVLLVDEPTTHLDVRHRLRTLSMLREEACRGVAVVAVVHDLALAAQADRCVLLAGGCSLAVGPPAVVLAPDALRDAFGVYVEVFRTAEGRSVAVPTRCSEPERIA